MLSVNKASYQPYSPNNQKSNSGVKVGLGMSALGVASAYGTPKLIDKMTGLVAKSARTRISGYNQIINDTQKSLAESAKSGIFNEEVSKLGKALIDETAKAKESVYNSAKAMFESRKILKNTSLKKALAIALPFYIGAGAIVDYANNKQRAKSEPNAETKNGNEYVKVNMGKKLGGFLGLACEGGILALNKAFNNAPKVSNPIATMAFAVGGGILLGAIADKISNKKAAKAADNNA